MFCENMHGHNRNVSVLKHLQNAQGKRRWEHQQSIQSQSMDWKASAVSWLCLGNPDLLYKSGPWHHIEVRLFILQNNHKSVFVVQESGTRMHHLGLSSKYLLIHCKCFRPPCFTFSVYQQRQQQRRTNWSVLLHYAFKICQQSFFFSLLCTFS